MHASVFFLNKYTVSIKSVPLFQRRLKNQQEYLCNRKEAIVNTLSSKEKLLCKSQVSHFATVYN